MLNRVTLIGNLGKDPELRYTPSGDAVATFSLATTERYKDREGHQQEKTEWHNIVVWRKLAEICGQYLYKGKQVYIEGKIQTRSYEDRDGNKRYTTEIVASDMKMLGNRESAQNGQGATRSGYEGQGQGQSSGYGGQQGGYGGQQHDSGYDAPPYSDDDIPF